MALARRRIQMIDETLPGWQFRQGLNFEVCGVLYAYSASLERRLCKTKHAHFASNERVYNLFYYVFTQI